MRLFRSFREDRALLRRSAEYAAVLMAEPSPADVEWLSRVATRGDVDHARWELRYARRALGQRPLWLGERFDGNRLQAVTIGSTFEPPTGISPKAATYVFYDYGNVAILEFNARDLHGARGGSLPGRMTLEKPDTLTSPSSSPSSVEAELSRDGVFVSVLASNTGNYVLNRAGALRVARALRPVPLP